MNKIIPFASAIGLLFLTACGNDTTPTSNASQNETTQNKTSQNKIQSDTTQADKSNNPANTTNTDSTPTPAIGADGKISLDLSKFNTGIAKADIATYAYPFAIDSVPVQNYANSYQISPQQAQHAMTLAMASPEALNKVLDEIVGEYLGHSLTDGKAMSLVVYTTDKVNPVQFDYVIADKFGEGLVLPVKVVQASSAKDKPQVDINNLNKVHSDTNNQNPSDNKTSDGTKSDNK